MIRKMLYVLCASVIFSFGLVGYAVISNQKQEFKNEIDRTDMKESRIEVGELKTEYIRSDYENKNFILTPTNIDYDSIQKFYTASNSHLVANYTIDDNEINLELTFKADGSFFLYHGLKEKIAYEGEYKLIGNTIYARINKIYNSNECYVKSNTIYEFDILRKNGRKVIDLMIGDTNFKEANKKALTETNTLYKNREKINICG